MQQLAPVADRPPRQTGAEAYDKVDKLRRRYDALKSSPERSNCEATWQECARLMSPRKATFLGLATPGENRNRQVLDPTGIVANEMLAAGLHGMATNPAAKWFSLRMVGGQGLDANGAVVDLNEDASVQSYLAAVEDIMWARLYQPGTNFTTAIHEFYLDLGVFGTGILFISQRETGGLIVECRPLAECVIAENADGKVDTVFRQTEYTVRQMIEVWGLAAVSEEVKAAYRDQRYEEKITVVHGVYPRPEKDREYGRKDRKSKPWASCYFEHKGCHLLEEGGFDEFPYLVGRWSKYSGEVYGRSPGMTALADVRMLQAMTLTKIKLLQKAADPPLWLRDDGVVGQTRTIPGGINYWRGNPNDGVMLQPVRLEGIQALAEDIIALREQIFRTFYADLMRMTDRANMTATEVIQRTSEQMRLFGPLIGRLESEVLGPLVERIFGILTRLGLLPPAPEAVAEKEFTVEYVSPIATAQKQTVAQSMVQVMQVVAGMFGPDLGVQIAAGNVDVVKLFRWVWDLFNCDPDLLKSEDDVAAEEQKAQMQQALGMAQPAADVLKKGASAVRDVSAAQGQEGGIDIQALLRQFAQNVQRNPRAQQEMAAMMQGETPSPPSLVDMGAA